MIHREVIFAELPYVSIDTETTGFYPDQGDRIVEVAFLKFHRGKVVDKIVRLVNPGIPIPPGVTKVHGITDDDVRGAQNFAEILPELLSFIRFKPVVAHNLPFDFGFLRAEAVRAGGVWPKCQTLDTLEMARQVGTFRNNKLATVAEAYGIEAGQYHRAEHDAYVAGMLLPHLLAEPRVKIKAIA